MPEITLSQKCIDELLRELKKVKTTEPKKAIKGTTSKRGKGRGRGRGRGRATGRVTSEVIEMPGETDEGMPRGIGGISVGRIEGQQRPTITF